MSKITKVSQEPEAKIKYGFVDQLRNALFRKNMKDFRYGRSKHHGSRYYVTLTERRKKKKVERLNRRKGRQ